MYFYLSEYKAQLVKHNKPREDDDFGDQEEFGHNSDTALSSLCSNISGSSTDVSSSDLNTSSTEQTTSMSSECSTISGLPTSQCIVATHSKALDNQMDNVETGAADYDKELQGKCFSSDNLSMNTGKDSAVKRPDLFRYKSWSPNSEGEVNGKNLESGKDGRSLNNCSVSHEPNRKKSKERKKSLGKKIINFISKTKRQKKSSEPSTSVEKSVAVEGNLDSCSETSVVSYSEPAPRPCENMSPLNVTEARRVSLESLSSGEFISSPTSPGYESGYMSAEGNVQCTFNFCICLLKKNPIYSNLALKVFEAPISNS